MTQKDRIMQGIDKTIYRYEQFIKSEKWEESIQESINGIGYKSRCAICISVNEDCMRCPIAGGKSNNCCSFKSYDRIRDAVYSYRNGRGYRRDATPRLKFWKQVRTILQDLPDNRFTFRNKSIGTRGYSTYIDFPELHNIIYDYKN